MKKKFSLIAYLLVMAMFILPMTGCDDDDDNSSGGKKNARTEAANKILVVESDAFEEGVSYNLYTGTAKLAGTSVEDPMYYIAPKQGDTVTLQLEFESDVSNDTGFVITKEGLTDVVFAYNPAGTGNDTSSTNVQTVAASAHKTSYAGLELSSALTTSSFETSKIGVEETAVKIVLDSSDNSVTVNSTKLTNYDGLVWHVSPDHTSEYWTVDGTNYDDEDNALDAAGVEKVEGIYVAKDIRYVPDYLTFSSSTVKKSNEAGDSDEMYVAYYTASGYTNYILAAIPTEMGAAMGGEGGPYGAPSGTPERAMRPAAVTDRASIISAMTHSTSEAAKNPVVHITKAGTYSIEGTWDGQIWIDIPDESTTPEYDSESDPNAQVILILNGVKVNCTVAPALVFKNVFECGPSSSVVSFDVANNLYDEADVKAGAVVVLADGSTNTFTGTNVARLNKITIDEDDYAETDVGTYVKAQKKMYKLDAALHSRMSMVLGLADSATSGSLNVISDYEGLDSEEHMLIESGTINVKADDDGINVNDDDVSVFTMTGGTLTISAGSSRQNSAGEAGIDAEKGVYIYDDSAYTWSRAGTSVVDDGGSAAEKGGEADAEPEVETHEDTITRDDGTQAGIINFKTYTIQKATYTPEQRIENGVAESGNIFKIYGTVNDFSGIK